MILYKNLTLIGTSHISKESVALVKKTIIEKRPLFVAVELDRGRLLALMEGQRRRLELRDIRKVGVRAFLFMLFGAWLQQKIAKMVGSKPGEEMKTAVVSAAQVGAKVLLIDQDVNVTIRKLLKTVTWKEKFRFVWDIFKGVVLRQSDVEPFDIRKVPPDEVIEKLIARVRERYPSFYTVLIDERNKIMGKKLARVMETHPDVQIVAVVGAGHEKAIVEFLESIASSSP